MIPRSLWRVALAAGCLVAAWPASGCGSSSGGGPPVLGSSSGSSGGGGSGGSSGGSGGSSGSSSGGSQGDATTGDAAGEGGFDAGHYEATVQDAVFIATDEGVPESSGPFTDGPKMVMGGDASDDGSGD